MALKVIKVVRVSPSTNSVADSESLVLPLTFFDLMWIRFHPVERVYFYRMAQLTRELFDSVILPKLKHSLSVVLCSYLPLTGHVAWDAQDQKPSCVVSSNNAVLLTVAESDADFTRLSGNEIRLATELRRLVPELPVSDESASVVSLQITLFPNQGFCIGVTAHHAVLDGKTALMFIKSWAHICSREQEHEETHVSLPHDLIPCFDRTSFEYPIGLDTKMLDLQSIFVTDKSKTRSLKLIPTRELSSEVVRVTRHLTREDIEKLRKRVKNELPHQEPYHFSTFVITYAYIWTCMVRARGGVAYRPAFLGFVADFRNRLNPPAPANYFGNFVVPVGIFEGNAGVYMGEKGFASTVKMISDAVRGLELRGIEKIYENILENLKRIKPGTQIGSVAGSTRLGVYGSDFGWGKPVRVEVVSIDQYEAFSLAETREETGGVEIGLCLNKLEMETFLSLFDNGLK